jgi:uncharacterized protein YmfQ (DUF2313 family)
MPTGRAWSRSTGVIPETLTGLAAELARLDSRIDGLMLERDARTTTELIDEHEVEWGLPDECLGSSSVLADRRAAVLAKIRAIGGLSPQYYIDVAAALGYTITITEFTPAWAGIMVAGDPCGDQDQLFYWLVNVHYDFVDPFTSFSDLQCMLEKIKPAHTIVLFQMYGPAFSNAFGSAFDAMPSAVLTKGAFSTAFDNSFDVFYGGDFDGTAFSDAFNKVYNPFGY